jgi:hypothetical protein
MELVKRTTLHFREGNSDKVYEVDLCRVGSEAVRPCEIIVLNGR